MDDIKKEKLISLKKMNREIFSEIMNTCVRVNNEIATLKDYFKSDPSNPIFRIEGDKLDKLIDRYYKVIELLFIMDKSIDYQLNKREENKDE